DVEKRRGIMCQMAQTDLALGGGGLRWASAAAVVTIVLAVGGGLAWFGWNSTTPGAPRGAGPAASANVTGDVAVEGAPPSFRDRTFSPSGRRPCWSPGSRPPVGAWPDGSRPIVRALYAE